VKVFKVWLPVGIALLLLGYIFWSSLTATGWSWFNSALTKVPSNEIAAWLPDGYESSGDMLPNMPPPVLDKVGDVVGGIVDTAQRALAEPPQNDPFPTPPEPKTFFTPAQLAAMSAVGIDTASLPTTMTPELETCFEAAIGRERVDAVINGVTPSLAEMWKAKGCL